MKVEVKGLEYDEAVNLLSTALYGSPWFSVDNTTKEYKESDGDTIEDKLVNMLYLGQEVIIIDTEEDKSYKLTYEKLLKGLSDFLNYYGDLFNIDDYDWCDADAVLQYALFGDVIYG